MVANDERVLYDDDCCTITTERLTIKMFYFPFGNKEVAPEWIDKLHSRPEETIPVTENKGWGYGVSAVGGSFDVWWALGKADDFWPPPEFRRDGNGRKGIVLEHRPSSSSRSLRGFSVRNREAALEAVEQMLAAQGCVVDKLRPRVGPKEAAVAASPKQVDGAETSRPGQMPVWQISHQRHT